MQVKTYMASRCNGDRLAYCSLDKQIEHDLGHDVEIISVADKAYGDEHTLNPSENCIIARVVVFNQPPKPPKPSANEEYFDPLA